MVVKKSPRGGGKTPKQYLHKKAKRPNNPHVGIAVARNEPEIQTTKYSFDPHLDPQLQWTGKNEKAEISIDTVPLHVHERIDPLTIIEKMLQISNQQTLIPFFDSQENNLPLSKAVDFYKHRNNWSNRLIAGDSSLIMNSLLEKEGLEAKVQMIYVDPPYGIKYASNFQPFVSKKNVKDKDSDLTQEPETISGYRDLWELGIHSYLSYIRDRLILAKQLLSESGSCFVQISIENMHLVRNVMDEIFGAKNFVSVISYRTKQAWRVKYLPNTSDYVIWYAKNKELVKSNPLYTDKEYGRGTMYKQLELEDGKRRKMTKEEENRQVGIPVGSKIFRLNPLTSPGSSKSGCYDVTIDDEVFVLEGDKHWKTTEEGMMELIKKKRVHISGEKLQFVTYYNDLPVQVITNVWEDTQGATDTKYVVQTSEKIIQRCMLMATDPGDLVLDPTCGSGTTAYIAEKFGRRWITCDTSRIAIAIAKQRIATSTFEYYKLAHSFEGDDVTNGFVYENVPHITLGQLANNEPEGKEELFDKPQKDKTRQRVAGPFTVEAVPSPTVKSIDVWADTDLQDHTRSYGSADELKHHPQQKWRDELYRSGIRGKNNQKIEFSVIETHPTTKWIHAVGETKESEPQHVAISFGPEHSPLSPHQVEYALSEASKLIPKISMMVFAAMHFDPEASKNIDQTKWKGITMLKVEMNKDMLTEDLKKKQSTNELFWIIGQPDISLDKIEDKYQVKVNGFDYFDIQKNKIISSDTKKIVMWMLDTNYDGRSVYPQQMFFPMSNSTESKEFVKLAKTLQSEINEEEIEKFFGVESFLFSGGDSKKIAVKIIDDRGIETLKILELE